MVSQLVDDHELIIRNLREHVDACGEQFHDQGTADFLTGLMEQHEEMAGCCVPSLKVNHSDPMVSQQRAGSRSGEVVDSRVEGAGQKAK